jgi:clan AA aspartic protease
MKAMGLVHAEIELVSVDDLALHRRGLLPKDDIRALKVRALVDSGAYMLAINENVKTQLGLPVIDRQVAELADGSQVALEVVGPVEVRFENRRVSADAMVLPGNAEVLLGSIPLEGMDVVIDPKQQKLLVNPATPYMPKLSLKRATLR